MCQRLLNWNIMMGRKSVKWVFKAIGRLALLVLAVLIAAEGLFQLSYFIAAEPDQLVRIKYYNTLQARIYRLWLGAERQDPFFPPYLVYANTGIEDEVRIHKIFETTRPKGPSVWRSHNFLQHESRAAETAYTIRINSLGFRGPEVEAVKPKSTFRIVALGSYQTFGLGLEDDATYPAALERELRSRATSSKSPVKFEVWNAGRAAGTAIAGYARMKKELFEYQPDLFIVDYGFMDLDVWGDNFSPTISRLPDNAFFSLLKAAVLPLVPYITSSFVWNRLHGKIFADRSLSNPNSGASKRLGELKSTLEAMLRLAAEKNVPVILLQQMLARPPAEMYLDLAKSNPRVHYVNVERAFIENGPTPEEWAAENWKETWLGEVGDRRAWAYSHYFRFYPYRLDYFQLNASGQKAIAKTLARKISDGL